MDDFLTDLLIYSVEADDLEGYLTGSGNFRNEIAVTAPYKGNRPGTKPEHYDFIRDYLQSEWGFTMAQGQEADDEIAIKATELGNSAVICSIDKDLDQVQGWHYNFVKRVLYYVTADDGLRSFYKQILTGDRTDNIIGIRGIGPVKAAKMLDGCTTEQEMYRRCGEAFGGDTERVLENGRLLWLKRHSTDCWSPPVLD